MYRVTSRSRSRLICGSEEAQCVAFAGSKDRYTSGVPRISSRANRRNESLVLSEPCTPFPSEVDQRSSILRASSKNFLASALLVKAWDILELIPDVLEFISERPLVTIERLKESLFCDQPCV